MPRGPFIAAEAMKSDRPLDVQVHVSDVDATGDILVLVHIHSQIGGELGISFAISCSFVSSQFTCDDDAPDVAIRRCRPQRRCRFPPSNTVSIRWQTISFPMVSIVGEPCTTGRARYTLATGRARLAWASTVQLDEPGTPGRTLTNTVSENCYR